MKRELAAVAVLYLVAHLLYLPPTLEDIDSINFALGVRDFDVARHQPHPPGYPVFIALAKASTGGLQAIGALAGTALMPLLFALFRSLGAGAHLAWWAMAVAACSPLMWFTALRPLSDMTGLALATATQVCLLRALVVRGLTPAARGLKTPGPQTEMAKSVAHEAGVLQTRGDPFAG